MAADVRLTQEAAEALLEAPASASVRLTQIAVEVLVESSFLGFVFENCSHATENGTGDVFNSGSSSPGLTQTLIENARWSNQLNTPTAIGVTQNVIEYGLHDNVTVFDTQNAIEVAEYDTPFLFVTQSLIEVAYKPGTITHAKYKRTVPRR